MDICPNDLLQMVDDHTKCVVLLPASVTARRP
jgi:hypothetical protein